MPNDSTSENNVPKTSATSGGYPKSVTAQDVLNEGVKISLMSFFISSALLPYDVLMDHLHTRKSAPAATMPMSNVAGGVRWSIWSRIGKAIVGNSWSGIFKNGVLQQRDRATQIIEERSFEETDVRVPGLRPSAVSSAKAALLIGGADAIVGSYFGVMRTLKTHGVTQVALNKPYIIPEPRTCREKLKIAVIGLDLRSVRCTLGAFGLITAPMLGSYLAGYASSENIAAYKFLASAGNGVALGFIGNGLDISYRQRVLAVDPKAFTAPTTRDVFKDIWRTQGIKGFVRGVVPAIGYSIITLNLVQLTDKGLDQHVMPHFDASSRGFFKSAKAHIKTSHPSTSVLLNEESMHERLLSAFHP